MPDAHRNGDGPARRLVPTDRQRAAGAGYEAPAADVFTGEDESPRRTLRELVKTFFRDADPRTIDGPALPLFVLGASALVTGWDAAALGVLLPDMGDDLGLDLAFLGVLASTLAIVDVLLSPAMGYVADRVQRVWMVRSGLVVGGASRVVSAVAPSLGTLVSSRALSGAAKGVTDPATFPLLTDYYAMHSRARVFAFLFAAGSIGGIVGPSVAGALSESFGWRAAFFAIGGLGTVLAVFSFWLREPKRGELDRLAMGASADDAAEDQQAVTWAEAWRSARAISTLRHIWYATPFLYAGTAVALPILLNLYYDEVFGLGSRTRGFLGTASAVVGLLGLAVSAPVADRLLRFRPGRIMTLFGGIVLMQGVVLLVLAVSPFLWLSVLISLPLGFAGALLLPALITLVSLVVPARIRGLGIQTIAPWQLLGTILFFSLLAIGEDWGIRGLIALFAPVLVIGGSILGSSSFGVERDIRSALAASMAELEARRARAEGRAKMLICRDIGIEYDGVQVLFGVDLDVEDGEILALLGTNGAGKSTLLRAIAGTQDPVTGAVFLDGDDVTHLPAYQTAERGVVLVPGGQAIFPTLTVAENLRTAAWLRRDDEAYVAEKVEEVLQFFPDLRERLEEPAGNLSGGQQQMVAIGQAFLMQPRLLMIDELSLGLAPAIVEQLLDTLRQIHAQGTTIILVEQSINVALTVAERAVFMEKGEIRFDGPTSALLEQPDLVRSVFMGGAVSGGGRLQRAVSEGATGDDGELLLSVADVSVRFGGLQALAGVDLEARAGEIVGIIGPNGAGKTTLFDVISGTTRPDGGHVVFDGHDVTALGPDTRARLGIGRSFQHVHLFPSLTVRENIAIAFERHLEVRSAVLSAAWAPNLRRAEGRLFRKVDRLIDTLGLDAYANKFVNELSTGTRRAVDMACVMASRPRVLLLDEPSSGLAQAETEELGPLIQRLVRETGCAAVVIEHDLPLVTSISTTLVAMELGSVIATGPPDEVVEDRRVIESYLAASQEVIARSGEAVATALATSAGIDLEGISQ